MYMREFSAMFLLLVFMQSVALLLSLMWYNFQPVKRMVLFK